MNFAVSKIVYPMVLCTVQTVRNYFGGNNYEYGKNCGLHIEPGPDGGIVVLDNTTIYDMAMSILQEENSMAEEK